MSVYEDGHVNACVKSVMVSYTARSQLTPLNPAIPALRIRTSNLGVDSASRRARARTDSRSPKSTCSGIRFIRLEAPASGRLEKTFLTCSLSWVNVSLLFFVLRVVNIRFSDWVLGREVKNSSISRRHIDRPKPLVAHRVLVFVANDIQYEIEGIELGEHIGDKSTC